MRQSSLCWKCKKTCGGCRWTKSFQPVPGWEAIETKILSGDKIDNSYLVIKCPEFKEFIKNNTKLPYDVYLRYIEYKHLLEEDEKRFVELKFKYTNEQIAKLINKSEKFVARKFAHIKFKLRTLEEIDLELGE